MYAITTVRFIRLSSNVVAAFHPRMGDLSEGPLTLKTGKIATANYIHNCIGKK